MVPEFIVVAQLFILRLGVPLLAVLGGGYLVSRYLNARAEEARKQKGQPMATSQETKKEERRKAA